MHISLYEWPSGGIGRHYRLNEHFLTRVLVNLLDVMSVRVQVPPRLLMNQCKNCGKEIKNSRKFCSISCANSFRKFDNKEFKCSKCGKTVRGNEGNLHTHEKYCDGQGTKLDKVEKSSLYWICPLCGYEIKKSNKDRHLNYCKGLGPRKYREPKYGHGKNWIRGKTYEEIFGEKRAIEIKAKIAKGASENYNYESQERYWTKERRKQKSEEKKKFFLENPEKHPNRILASNRNNLSYPEKLVINYLEENNINFESQYKIKSYYVDFLLDNNVVIEIDGSYWHNKDDLNEINRQKEIEKEGYKVYRIDAKNVLRNLENLQIF